MATSRTQTRLLASRLRWQSLVICPSFWGAVTWGGFGILYLARLAEWNPPSLYFWLFFAFVEVLFIAATIQSRRDFSRVLLGEQGPYAAARQRVSPMETRTLLICHGIGFLGLGLYLSDMMARFGGLGGLLDVAGYTAHEIRIENRFLRSPGTQLAYVGWFAAAATVYAYGSRKVSGWIWILCVCLQIVGNFAWLDRTRPLWVLSMCGMAFLFARPWLARKSLGLLAVPAVGVLFAQVGTWVGKSASNSGLLAYGDSVLSGWTLMIYVYGTGGFALLDSLMLDSNSPEFFPTRIFHPLWQLGAALGIGSGAATHILDFRWLPFPTNTGTFVSTFYLDGGLFFALLGALLYSFGANAFALALLRRPTPLGVAAWSSVIFIVGIGFFVPKINTTALWATVLIGILSILGVFQPRRSRRVR